MNESQDPLDTLLHEQNVYIQDAGFTARVIESLPRRRSRWLRQSFLIGVSTIGWILAAWWLPWGNLPALNASALLSPDSQALLPCITVFVVVGALVWSTIAAVQWDD